jgi:hypothetical protein
MEADEHRYLGNSITLRLDSGSVAASSLKLAAGGTGAQAKSLTYGDLVALGGDFFGVPAAPICLAADPNAAFANAYGSLAGCALNELTQILTIMDAEHNAVQTAVSNGQSAASAYDTLGDDLSMKWNVATGGKNGLDLNGRYLGLAAKNFDHFGQCAIAAYSAGHQVALDAAAGIASQNLPLAQQVQALQHAYAQNAFADHFLSDVFSSGHMRTPRQALYGHTTPSALGSLLARGMHDEDCKYGLTVHNERGDTWVAYGDKQLMNPLNQTNLKYVTQALQASADEVWAAYKSEAAPGASTWAAMLIVPELALVQNKDAQENFSPMFIEKLGTTAVRKSRKDRTLRQWTRAYIPAAIFAELQILGWVKGPPE